jgi:hypothetical protein
MGRQLVRRDSFSSAIAEIVDSFFHDTARSIAIVAAAADLCCRIGRAGRGPSFRKADAQRRARPARTDQPGASCSRIAGRRLKLIWGHIETGGTNFACFGP